MEWNNEDLGEGNLDNFDFEMSSLTKEVLNDANSLNSQQGNTNSSWDNSDLELSKPNSLIEGSTNANIPTLSNTNAEPMHTTSDAKRRLKEEGFRDKIYRDSRGFKTIGIGHKLTASDIKSGRFKNGITRAQAEALYLQDEKREQGLLNRSAPELRSAPDRVRGVLKDMAFNMGGAFLKEWKNFRKMLARGDYRGASRSIRRSRYYKQVPNRAERNARILESMG